MRGGSLIRAGCDHQADLQATQAYLESQDQGCENCKLDGRTYTYTSSPLDVLTKLGNCVTSSAWTLMAYSQRMLQFSVCHKAAFL